MAKPSHGAIIPRACVLRVVIRRHQHLRTHAPSGASGSAAVGGASLGVWPSMRVSKVQKKHAFAHFSASERCDRCVRTPVPREPVFLACAPSYTCRSFDLSRQPPSDQCWCRARGSPSCAPLFEAYLRGNWVTLLLAPGREERVASCTTLDYHDRMRERTLNIEVRSPAP